LLTALFSSVVEGLWPVLKRTKSTLDAPERPDTLTIAVTFEGRAGVLHRPDASAVLDTAVVICPPVGREARCAYRALWRWSGRLAEQGLQVLRYDHLGEGDSLDIDPQADQWPAWVEGARRAVAFAREQAGAERIVLFGLRAGANVAAAAATDTPVEGLVLVAPFDTGAALLNEQRLAARVKGGEIHADGAIEVDGLQLSTATVRTLEDIRLPQSSAAPTLVAGPRTGRLGANGDSMPFPGLHKLFKDAHINEFPQAPLERIGEWILQSAAPAASPPTPCPAGALNGGDWTEAAVTFGPGLRGTLCLPRRGGARQAVIFGNTGGDPRAGIGSFAARASRAIAASGVAALRIDFEGLGESAARGGWRSHVYETSRIADFQAAAAVLRAQGVDDITLAGVCTGGYHAVHGVLAGAGFKNAVAINAWLVWRKGADLEAVEYRSQLRSADMPLLANGRGSTLLDQLRWRVGRLREALRLSMLAARPDETARAARQAIEAAGRRGARLHLVFGKGDVSMRGLHADFQRSGRWLSRRPGVSIALVSGLDHALFSRDSQAAACVELCKFLGVRRDLAEAIAGPDDARALAPPPPEKPRRRRSQVTLTASLQ